MYFCMLDPAHPYLPCLLTDIIQVPIAENDKWSYLSFATASEIIFREATIHKDDVRSNFIDFTYEHFAP